MVPLISQEMMSNGWMTSGEVSDILAIAEMTPGPLGLNCAAFAGMKAAGVLGAAAAGLGVLMPTLTVTVLAALFLQWFRDSRVLKMVMSGVRPACVGLIFGVAVSLSLTNYTLDGAISLPCVALGLLDLVLLLKYKWGVPRVIAANALAGIVLFGALGL